MVLGDVLLEQLYYKLEGKRRSPYAIVKGTFMFLEVSFWIAATTKKSDRSPGKARYT